MSIVIRPMQEDDINAVHDIEKICFSSPWSKNSFFDELNENVCARYFVAIIDNAVIGYGGMWLIINEAHITNIAIHPKYRRMKVGTKILMSMMELAYRELEIKKMTLEVRKSNLIAQTLYEKYGFQIKGTRKKYYDNKEDALILWCEDIKKYIISL